MNFAYLLSGGAPIVKKFQVNATLATAGIPVTKGGANTKGVIAATTTAAVGMVGVTLDTATYAAGQNADKSDQAAYVSVIINPGAVWRAKLCGGATENTALPLFACTTASATGLSVTATGVTDLTSPTMDEGVIFGYDGANGGIGRKITSVAATVATVITAFPRATVVGDRFFVVPLCGSPFGFEASNPQLTTLLTQVDATAAVTLSNVNFNTVEMDLRDVSQSGSTNSFVDIVSNGHLFSAGLVV
jgi:hypothetical protein